ncbi:MAG: transglycosylase SLT domain-containing protein [Bacteroidia bacterium]|nr:transglycosylase SLT domain-containing protein [Bacteroidia bacterium]
MKRVIYILIFFPFIVFSQAVLHEDDPIAAMLDSLYNKKVLDVMFQKSGFNKNNKYHFSPDSVPIYDDNVYEARLAKLNVHSPFDLIYNIHVKAYIDLYTIKKRDLLSRLIGLSQLYYPMFEQVLDKYNLPLELKHLAVIESALNPNARSRAGAQGLWQFMYPTGKLFGLKITSYIDERCDPYKSTIAAAEYLKYLYSIFKDWQMVLAAYNAGPGTISKAIRRSGGKTTYWEIRPYLPKETQGYVPAFIAANYVMNYYSEHNILPTIPKKNYFELDTVVLKESMSFQQISQLLDVPVEEIIYFNPQYRQNIIPEGGHILTLPKEKISLFLSNEEEIYAFIQSQKKNSQTYQDFNTQEEKIVHKVKKGETLKSIAKKYGITVSDIKMWNFVGKRGIKPGKNLIIYKPVQNKNHSTTVVLAENKGSIEKNDTAQSEKNNTSNDLYHIVKKGETIYSIAKKYNIDIKQLAQLNNVPLNHKVVIGEKLLIKKTD